MNDLLSLIGVQLLLAKEQLTHPTGGFFTAVARAKFGFFALGFFVVISVLPLPIPNLNDGLANIWAGLGYFLGYLSWGLIWVSFAIQEGRPEYQVEYGSATVNAEGNRGPLAVILLAIGFLVTLGYGGNVYILAIMTIAMGAALVAHGKQVEAAIKLHGNKSNLDELGDSLFPLLAVMCMSVFGFWMFLAIRYFALRPW